MTLGSKRVVADRLVPCRQLNFFLVGIVYSFVGGQQGSFPRPKAVAELRASSLVFVSGW